MAGSPEQRNDLQDLARAALARGYANLATLQTMAGSWNGDYGGPMFLLPMYIALHRVTGRPIPAKRALRMVEYILNVQNSDGSIGLHSEGDGCMFTTVLCYVALRYLGLASDDPRITSMHTWIRSNGTPLAAAPWGKFTLAFLNLYDYVGLNPVPPELWLLPPSVALHPGRMWCHARIVYLPMSWLYGTRSRIPEDDLCQELRSELYDRPYGRIRFSDHRDTIAPCDNYRPATPLLGAANRALLAYEKIHSRTGRRKALNVVARHLDYEDFTTGSLNLGPVNAILNRVCHHFRNPKSDALANGWDAIDEYVWDGHDGTKFNGYQSTEMWDTAFAVQAFQAHSLAAEYRPTIAFAHEFIRDNQVLEDTPDFQAHFRHPSRGGWPFSTRRHGWPITDCTAEGLKVAISCEPWVPKPVPESLMHDAARLILSFQNDDGGWASYERTRGPGWLELLNPSHVFGDIMVDSSYPECTSACLQGLAAARRRFPGMFDNEIDRAIRQGVEYLRGTQRADGSWEGSWGVCFTYGTLFGVSGLLAAGVARDDPAILRSVRFLLTHQMQDGGWGEHYRSCSERRLVPLPAGHAVMTSWALLSLVRAGCDDDRAMRRAARFLVDRQAPDGGWPRETMAGVFNRTCLINYDNYRHYFPVWALAEWSTGLGS